MLGLTWEMSECVNDMHQDRESGMTQKGFGDFGGVVSFI